ncbi:endonuclease subunit UvrC [Spirochaetia bacterium]|nr:endonuclease subunit UvrC [Spirochaetia bacterium]
MDGGSHVRPAKNTNVKTNIEGVRQLVSGSPWDAVLIQEVDTRSLRSYWLNQVEYLTDGYRGSWAFGYNFKTPFVPFPIPPIGPVGSGILNMTVFTPREATRIALPSPFSWPVRTANLKRCLLAEWIPLAGSDKELVLVNLHLEAYSSESGRAAQMRLAVDFLNAEYARGNYVIAGGDFNQSFPGLNPELFRIKNSDYFVPGTLTQDMLQPGWRFAADTQTPSSRLLNEPYSGSYADTQLYVIDGFILSPNVRLESVKTLADGFKYSDHHPVSIEVVLE